MIIQKSMLDIISTEAVEMNRDTTGDEDGDFEKLAQQEVYCGGGQFLIVKVLIKSSKRPQIDDPRVDTLREFFDAVASDLHHPPINDRKGNKAGE